MDIPCYYILGNSQKIVKMQFIFPAGRKHESKPAQSRMCNMLLKEGCGAYDTEAFATQIDNYGFVLKVTADLDYAYITLICLRKFFDKGLDLVKEMIYSPRFDSDDIQRIATISAQNLRAQLERNELLAYRAFTQGVFGPEHIYGYNTQIHHFKEISREDLLEFHRNQYDPSGMQMIISGDVDDDLLKSLAFTEKFKETHLEYPQPIQETSGIKYLPSTNELQLAIKYGKRLFSRAHPDYPDLFILNTLFGGYFGSRLMRNIREDKGYAYNIYSSIESMQHDGYLSINCEVGKEHLVECLKEIEKEMDILKSTEIPSEEMKMLRNYMMGQLMHSLDGPFASAEMLSSLICNQLDLDFLHKLVNRIKLITTFELRTIAQKHLIAEDFMTVIVGAKS